MTKILAPLFKYIKYFDKSVSLYLPGQANYLLLRNQKAKSILNNYTAV